ncbi:hypothetical protein L208DRAFT_1398021 [Tricholoma matsutake]|nr:hypothetical protein L208DRAFT_1398021 [Tricholoma matsutake 945]
MRGDSPDVGLSRKLSNALHLRSSLELKPITRPKESQPNASLSSSSSAHNDVPLSPAAAPPPSSPPPPPPSTFVRPSPCRSRRRNHSAAPPSMAMPEKQVKDRSRSRNLDVVEISGRNGDMQEDRQGERHEGAGTEQTLCSPSLEEVLLYPLSLADSTSSTRRGKKTDKDADSSSMLSPAGDAGSFSDRVDVNVPFPSASSCSFPPPASTFVKPSPCRSTGGKQAVATPLVRAVQRKRLELRPRSRSSSLSSRSWKPHTTRECGQRNERGWSGGWNRGDMGEVVKALRELKAR